MSNHWANLFFTILVLITVVPAILLVFTRNIVRAACWLLLSLTGAAGLFFFMGADFVGAVQLLIYVGGTLVLVVFGVMLTATGPLTNFASRSGDWVLGLVVGVALFALVAYGVSQPTLSRPSGLADTKPSATTQRIGMSLLGFAEAPDAPASGLPTQTIAPPTHPAVGYLLPFEIVSVHLVVVLIGAAYLARAKRRQSEEV